MAAVATPAAVVATVGVTAAAIVDALVAADATLPAASNRAAAATNDTVVIGTGIAANVACSLVAYANRERTITVAPADVCPIGRASTGRGYF